MIWPVVPICNNQMKDVNKDDVLEDGLYRVCNTYKGGGGYDQYPKIFKKRFKKEVGGKQFVAQLYGCTLKCPYCYVTNSGIFGKPTYINTYDILNSFENSKCDTFHLMGGAPAIYLSHWRELANRLGDNFHSDFLLVEKEYKKSWLVGIKGVHAVSIKESYLYTDNQVKLMFRNLQILVDSGINFYLTFTGECSLKREIVNIFGPEIMEDSFDVRIIEYKSLRNRL